MIRTMDGRANGLDNYLVTAHRKVMPSVGHRSHMRLNNRAENNHQPTR